MALLKEARFGECKIIATELRKRRIYIDRFMLRNKIILIV
jgi:hypothetical protein